MIDFRGTGAGKRFENLVLERLKAEGEKGNGDFGRYGVQTAFTQDGNMIALSSLPDIEGVLAPDGRQVIFDCKVESGSSFNLSKYRASTKGARRRQLSHMLKRSRCGVICFFLIHFNSRELKTKSEPSETFAIHVDAKLKFWRDFESGVFTTISRDTAREVGYPIAWNTISSREIVLRPDVLSVAYRLLYGKRNIVFSNW